MSAACYARNGEAFKGSTYEFDNYVPCNQSAVANNGHTACCSVNDHCLPNGLCINPGNEEARDFIYWRVGCTDQTFGDSSCPAYCAEKGDAPGNPWNALVFYCMRSKSWCCAFPGTTASTENKRSCCDDSGHTFEADDPIISATAQVQQSLTSACISQTSRRSILPLTTTTPHRSESLPPSMTIVSHSPSSVASSQPSPLSLAPTASSRPLKIGLGFGLSAVIVLMGAVVVLWVLVRRKIMRLEDALAEEKPQARSLSAVTTGGDRRIYAS
ncbi:hypothetical protein K458DRAFT_400471 [Lentithecium fluviatile CBS 122367]|uniref:Mid2 domain-containing protein n=1 Tax=Lentithecium fluviatile CBS 122367 TaxID=1168545 RepID=A0A6G1JGU1_9PLEO|nr:hypothetical protein K458DRAFT_400471 [Lentithecium fluviatile CBS 122367]